MILGRDILPRSSLGAGDAEHELIGGTQQRAHRGIVGAFLGPGGGDALLVDQIEGPLKINGIS